MVAIKLDHSDLAQHHADIFKRLHAFRKDGQLCDVVLKSSEGTEHHAHTAVLCAASEDLKNLLVGSFVESNQVQQGQPVEIAASEAVVFGFLEYTYGQQPQVEEEEAFELLHLADAYNCPQLTAAIEVGLPASLDSAPVTTALKILQQTHNLSELKVACEEKVAENFELCIEQVEFLDLSAGQLGRILRSDDLKVSREEVVLKGLFNWLNKSKDRGICLGSLLLNVDLQSLSSSNLAQLQQLSASMGPAGHDLQREVEEALHAHKKRSAAKTLDTFRPKRRCLQHLSPDLGASVAQKVLPPAYSLCWHDGAIYYSTISRASSDVLCFRDNESARVKGGNDLAERCIVSASPEGSILVADIENWRLVRYQNGRGTTVLDNADLGAVSCSSSGAVYVTNQPGDKVEKLIGATLDLVISNQQLPAELQFDAVALFATKEEALYITDTANSRILRINPGDTEPAVVGEAPNKETSGLCGLFVTAHEKVYVADGAQQKVWAFHPGDAAWTEVLTCPGVLKPVDVLVQGSSLYVSMVGDDDAKGTYEYLLPPELKLV